VTTVVIIKIIVAFIAAYLLGSIPSAYIAGRLKKKIDIRTVGSHNMGAMNTFYNLGKITGVLVLAADILKVFAAVAFPDLLDIPRMVEGQGGEGRSYNHRRYRLFHSVEYSHRACHISDNAAYYQIPHTQLRHSYGMLSIRLMAGVWPHRLHNLFHPSVARSLPELYPQNQRDENQGRQLETGRKAQEPAGQILAINS